MSCHFCQKNIRVIDFKDRTLLGNFVSSLGKIRPRKKTGVCSKHQRLVANAIKRARQLNLL